MGLATLAGHGMAVASGRAQSRCQRDYDLKNIRHTGHPPSRYSRRPPESRCEYPIRSTFPFETILPPPTLGDLFALVWST